jgi:hypothetical protein
MPSAKMDVPPLCVPAGELSLGALLAEGGEGRVFEVAASRRELGGAGLVYKQLRRQRTVAELAPTVSFLQRLEAADPGLAARARSSSAWPAALVVGDDPGVAVGVLMPRAPGAFWVRHREGELRLATLSYLASDPDRITVAYGTVVPAPGAAARVGIVYVLARLLEAWQAGGHGELAVHGDLSAKNVLWSLDPVPAAYVLDCDGATVVSAGEDASGAGGPPRATTPNWEDPALPSGSAPGAQADRYALGLAFLRVVGAAHFPLQARQRAGGKVSIDFEVPRSWRRLPDIPGLWDVCERSLSVVEASRRPGPGEWAAVLEQLLSAMGASELAARARAAQGDRRPSLGERDIEVRSRERASDVEVRPVIRHRVAPAWRLVDVSAPSPSPAGLAGLGLSTGLGPRQILRRCGQAWAGAHRLAWRLVCSRGRRRDGFRRLARVLAVDLAGACLVLFLVGMIVSPWIGL